MQNPLNPNGGLAMRSLVIKLKPLKNNREKSKKKFEGAG